MYKEKLLFLAFFLFIAGSADAQLRPNIILTTLPGTCKGSMRVRQNCDMVKQYPVLSTGLQPDGTCGPTLTMYFQKLKIIQIVKRAHDEEYRKYHTIIQLKTV